LFPSLALSPSGARLAVGCPQSPIVILSADTGQELLRFNDSSNRVAALAFSPDGKLLASGGTDGTVRLWEAATGAELLRLAGHGERVTSVAFGLGGRLLASGSADTTVLLWDVWGTLSGTATKPLTPAEQDSLWADLASPDGARAFRA